MVRIALAIVLAFTGANNKSQSYEDALDQAQKESKPILIIVGAKWCAACEVMKRETVEPMKAAGELSDVVLAFVDKDQRPELAQQLMKGETLPQTILFTKENDQWRRLSVTGLQSKSRIQELIGRVAKVPSDKTQIVR